MAAAITIRAIGRNARKTMNVLLDKTYSPVFGGEGGVADYSARGKQSSKRVNRQVGNDPLRLEKCVGQRPTRCKNPRIIVADKVK